MSPPATPLPPPPPAPYPQPPYPQGPYAAQPYAPQPYPPMYAAPVVMAPVGPPGANTFDGLKFLKWATLLVLVLSAIGFLAGLLTFVALATLPPGADIFQIGAAIGAASALGLISLPLSLIAFILGMVALYKLNQGKMEFGEAHSQSVSKGVRYFAFTLGVYLIGIVGAVIITVVMVASLLTAPNFAPGAFAGMAFTLVALTGAVGIVTTYLAAISMQSFVEKLMTAEGRAKRGMFIMLSLVGAFVELGAGLAAATMFGSFFGNPALASEATAVGSTASAVTIVTMFIYWKQVESAEAGARAMIASGRFDPDAGAVAAAVPAVAAYPPTPPV